jgi:hypothetical protein
MERMTKTHDGIKCPVYPGPFESCGTKLKGERLREAEEEWKASWFDWSEPAKASASVSSWRRNPTVKTPLAA